MQARVAAFLAALLLGPLLVPAAGALAAAPAFADVPQSYWAAQAIDALAAQGVIEGEADGLFHPNAPVSRAQFAAMVVRAEGLPTVSVGPRFQDVPPQNALYGAVETAAASGLMLGVTLTRFAPSVTITRAMAVAIAVRALGLAPVGQDLSGTPIGYRDAAQIPSYARGDVVVAQRLGLMQGVGGLFSPSGALSRAQAAAVVYRMLQVTPASIAAIAAPLVHRISAAGGQSSIAVGQSTALAATARDASGLPVPAQVTWSVNGSPLAGPTFSAQAPGTYRVTASVYGSAVTQSVTIHVEQATSLAINGLPEVVGPGAAVPVQVTVLDQTGSRDGTDGARAITLTATNGSVGPVTLTQTAQGGQTTFSFTPPAAGAWALTASATGLPSAKAAFDVLASPFPRPMTISGPTSILPGRTASLRALLPQGASESSPVAVTSSNPAVLAVQGAGSGSLTRAGLGISVQARAPGTATLTVRNTAGAYQSASWTVTVPSLGALSLSPPATGSAGGSTPAVVSVRPGATPAPQPTVTLTLVNPQGVTFATMTRTAQSGTARFTLHEDEAGTWRLQATAPGYATATAPWVVQPGPAVQLIATGAPSTVVVAGQTAHLAVMLADRYDNPVAAPLSVSLAAHGSAGTLSPAAAPLPGPGTAATFQALAPGVETVVVRDPARPDLAAVPVTFRVIAAPADVAAGKGFWLLASDLGKTPAHGLIAQLTRLGVTHVYLEVEGSWGFYGSSELRSFLFRAHDAGIAVLAWVYPYLKNVPLDESLTAQVARYVAPTGDRPDGIAADIEETTTAAAVGSYAAAVRQALGPQGVLIAVTYPPIYHASYPFAALAPYVTLFAPMDYWHYQAVSMNFTQTYQYVSQTVSLIRQLSADPSAAVSVIGQSYDMFTGGDQGVFSPTPLEVQAAFQAASDAGAIGISFYRLPTATASELQAIGALPYPDPSR